MDPRTYLPARITATNTTFGGPAASTFGTLVTNVQWLKPTAANKAKALVTDPARVQAGQQPGQSVAQRKRPGPGQARPGRAVPSAGSPRLSSGRYGPGVTTRALVLGGGGVTGVAWEIGLLAGLAARGVQLGGADLIVGTSAGSVVGAQLAWGTSLDQMYTDQLAPPGPPGGAARLRPAHLARYAWAMLRHRDPVAARAQIGRLATTARTMPEAERRR